MTLRKKICTFIATKERDNPESGVEFLEMRWSRGHIGSAKWRSAQRAEILKKNAIFRAKN